MQISDDQKKILAIMGVIIVLLGIFYLIDWLTVLQYQQFGHIIFFVGLYVLIKNIVRLFVFPGSFWLWRRNVENRYAKALANRANKRMEDLANLIRKFLQTSDIKEVTAEDLNHLKKTLQSFLHTFSSLNYRKELNQQQVDLFNLCQQLEQNLKDLIIDNKSLYDLLDHPEEVYNLSKKNLMIDIQIGASILNVLEQLTTQLQEIFSEKNIFKTMERWIFNRTLGTVDQMRVELENTFRTKRIKIQAYDGKLIDWSLYIYAQEEESEENAPTVIFCQPNAGYYEYMYYESEWIDYYQKRGINMFLWNYRGYCESQGLPNTKDIQRDAESIYDYVQQQLKATSIIVHGESLGGMVACHVGKARQCSLVFADRTFSSISKIAQVGFSKYASFFFNLLTSWDYDSAQSFVECLSPKILATDLKDETIPFLSSLKVGVGKQVFVKEFTNQLQSDENFRQSDQKVPFIQKVIQCIPWIPKQESKVFYDIWYTFMLNKQEMITFFEANQRIQNLMRDLQTERSKKTLDDSYSTYLNESQDFEKQFQQQNQNQAVDVDEVTHLQGPYALSEREKSNETLLKFVSKLYECFEAFEAASMTLNDVFSLFGESQQYEIFLDYLLSIFFWGSYLPLKNISKKKMGTQVCQKLAFARFTSNINKIETLIKNEKNNLDSPNGLRLIQDLDLIIQRLKLLRENFKKCMRNSNQQQTSHQSVQVEQNEDKKSASKQSDSLKNHLGSFLPLQCGHNGNLNQTEVEVLDFHMMQAGVVRA